MAKGFTQKEVSKLLVECHRRCCVCHRFCGVKMEIDHIEPRAEDGSDNIDNAIPVCFECHAEIHSYNDKHPRGRKFRPDELRAHKSQWLEICKQKPEVLIGALRNSDVGPLQALIDELEFNARVSQGHSTESQGCPFEDKQFHRAIHEGAIAILREEIKNALIDAYIAMGSANQIIVSAWSQPQTTSSWAEGTREATRKMKEAQPKIERAKAELLQFLKSAS